MRKCKIVRKFVKDEKRILKLMYKKGLLNKYKIDELYWDNRVSIGHGIKYKSPLIEDGYYWSYCLAPELIFMIPDYWGECDEYSLIDDVLERLFWDNIIDEYADEPESTFNCKGRTWLIKYLSSLPNKMNKNYKIKKIIRRVCI